MSLATDIEAALERVGREYKLIVAGKGVGQASDQVFPAGTELTIVAFFSVVIEKQGELNKITATGNISGAALDRSKPPEEAGIYTPQIGDKIVVDGNELPIAKLEAVGVANDIAVFKVEAVL